MTLFWIISATMMLVALAILAPTLLRQHAAKSDATEQFNVAIAREHLAELVKQKEAGDLSEEEFSQAKQDVELALAEDLEGTAKGPAPLINAGGRWALPLAALLIPLIAIPTYLQIGSPELIGGQSGGPVMSGHGKNGQMPPVEELVKQLRQRMEANPENADGWFLLGRTYMRLQNYPEAVFAFEHVVELLPEETAGLLSLADAMTMRDGRRVGARAQELLQKALSIDPASVTALWLLGNASADKGDNATALDYWQRAYPLLGAEPAMQAELGQMITQAGGSLPKVASTLPPIMTTAGTASNAPQKAGADTAAGASIVVEVALAPSLMEQVSPTDTVFVLARAESGPPMPLAVARHQAAELPLRVTLTDAMAMMPAMKLSSFPRVKISAKISKSGQAGTQAGDMIASDSFVETANPPGSVQLVIDRVVE
ncbi:MAG: c-type cytochrome biogenesis protein CcmI [Chromatiaceae bacterium]|nr:c-type cytochrome biogenesis protein CcmI [Chromatiaceae bacterium]